MDISEKSAYCLFITNIFLPGIGTMICAFSDLNGFNCWAFVIGIIQLALTAIFIGWLWAICHGYCQYCYSRDLKDLNTLD